MSRVSVETDRIAITPEQMVPGKWYRVEFFDCCAEGWFEGVYVEPVMVPNMPGDPPNFQDGWRFSNGEIGPASWGQWRVFEAVEP